MPTVFISAATVDLREWREVLDAAFRRGGFRVLTQDKSLGSALGDVKRHLMKAIAASDCVVHLAGMGYGGDAAEPFPEAPTFECSWTQFEYYHAHQQKKDVIAFVCAPALSARGFQEKGKDAQDIQRKLHLQDAHRRRVAKGSFDGTPLAIAGRTSNEQVNSMPELLTAVAAAVGTLHQLDRAACEHAQRELRDLAQVISRIEVGVGSANDKLDRILAMLTADRGLLEAPFEAIRELRLGGYDGEVGANVERRQAVIGTAASWRSLREGRYAPRDALISSLAELFDRWWLDGARTRGDRYPAFWLDGRSGDGKSVALLQLAERHLQMHGDAIVVKLDDPSRLAEAVRWLQRYSDRALILVDDLHRVSANENLGPRIRGALEEGCVPIPIIACGPTPERKLFEFTHRSLFAVTHTSILSPTADDRAEICAWLGKNMPSTARDDILLVELLFELQVGEPIPLFASSFRTRLTQVGIVDAMYSVLAVNALDVAAPHGLIAAGHGRDFIERLAGADQRHFDMEAPLPNGENGIRFSHTRIAWAVFWEWTHKPLTERDDREMAKALLPALCAVKNDHPTLATIVGAFFDRWKWLQSGDKAAPTKLGIRRHFPAIGDDRRRVGHRAEMLGSLLVNAPTNERGFDLLVAFKRDGEDRRGVSTLRLIAGDAAAIALESVHSAALRRPNDARDLLFLIAVSSGFASGLGQRLLALESHWPRRHMGFFWRAILGCNDLEPMTYLPRLVSFLERNRSREVVRALAKRSDYERNFWCT